MDRVVFTNGCFDLLHPGHIELLTKARSLGTKLIVGLNSDNSVRRIKGITRPILNQKARAAILRGLRAVDEVRIFDENTPAKLIEDIKPDVLVKGGDWSIEQIVGADFVIKNGGQVFSIPFKSDFSSSKIVEKIKESNGNEVLSVKASENDLIETLLKNKIELFQKLLKTEIQNIRDSVDLIKKTVSGGNKIIIYGNNTNVLISKSLAAEFNRCFKRQKQDLSVLHLEENISIFLEEKVKKGDLLIAFSIGGNSGESNILKSIMQARQLNCRTIGITGIDGSKMAALCDNAVLITSDKDFLIQEAFLAIGHIWINTIEKEI